MADLAALGASLAGRYRIERELGAGGMATVWLAHDLKHDRKVAIKVLHPHLAALVGADRFLKEIRTTANLQHPHILPLFDSGEADGLLFYVMPFVDGESLRQRITREKQLPIADAVRITSEIASALDYAHRQGVIHRDIKPENILLHDGRALVADFGIALASNTGDTRLTETGLSIGTPSYMSPEQALGERQLDARTDIYAVGAVLYEMLTGTPPFTGPSVQAITAKVLSQKPVPPSRLRREIPGYVEDVALTALEKEPADRYPSAADMAAALAQGGARVSRRRIRRRRARALAGAALLIIVGIAGYVVMRHGTPPLRVALLPFANRSGDSTYTNLGDGLTSDIGTALRQVPGLTTISASESRFRNPDLDVKQVGRDLNVDAVLAVSLELAGKIAVIRVTLEDAKTLDVRSAKYNLDKDSLYQLEDNVSQGITKDLGLHLTAAHASGGNRRTANPVAHALVVEARGWAEQRRGPGLDTAIKLYTAAITLDSTYAEAWAGRSTAHNLRAVLSFKRPSEEFIAAMDDVRHAMKLDSTAAEPYTTLGFIHVFQDRDWKAAADNFKRSLALDPAAPATWLYLIQYYIATNHLDSAISAGRKALLLDPTSQIAATRLATALYMRGDLRDAESTILTMIHQNPGGATGHPDLSQILADDNHCEQAMAETRQVLVGTPQYGEAMSRYAMARCGHQAEARQFIDSMERQALSGKYVDDWAIAMVYAGLDDRTKTLDWLDKAFDNGDWEVFQLRVHPAFRKYRQDPRFQEFLRRARL